MTEDRICNKKFNGFWISGSAAQQYLLTLILCFSSVLFQSNQQHKNSHHNLFVPLFIDIFLFFNPLVFIFSSMQKGFLETVIGYSALNCEIKFYLHLVYAGIFVYFEFKSPFLQCSKIYKNSMFHLIQNVLMSFVSKIGTKICN